MKILIFLFCANITFSQNFNIGYQDGWPIGYCYDAQYGCMAPPSPLAPYPKIGESSSSYWDGYHRGLSEGIQAGRKNRNQNTQSNSSTYQSYGVPQYIPKYEPFTPDLNFYNQALSQLQSKYNKKQNDNSSLHDATYDLILKYYSSEEAEKRKNLIKFINMQYDNFSDFTEEIPDGVYNAYYINDTKYSLPPIFEDMQLDECEIREVIVEKNKIIWVKYKRNDKLLSEFDPLVLPNIFSLYTKTLSSSQIKNGLCFVTNSLINKGNDLLATNDAELSSKNARYYFIEYLTNIKESKILLDQIQAKYNNADKNQIITDGWHVCYLSNRVDFCEIRNVYIKNQKIIKWICDDGSEAFVNSGGEIFDLKSTFSRKSPPFTDGKSDNMKNFWKNTFMSKSEIQIYDAYFINL